MAFAARVDERIGVRAEAVDVAIALRQPAIREQDRDLVQALRRQRPEIPHRGRRAQVGLRMALLRVDEVGKFQRIADEEHRRVVADDVPIALLGVELQRKAAHVALGIRRTTLAGDGREAQEQLPSSCRSSRSTSAFVYLRDVVGDGQRAIGTRALGVHGALRNALAVLMRELFEQMEVLEQHRAARAGGQRILVIGDRRAAIRRKRRRFCHKVFPEHE